jgi:FkbM family methyltransferase
METPRKIARHLLWKVCGRNIGNIEAIPILYGPLRDQLLSKQPALDQISMLFGRYEPAVVKEILHLPEPAHVAYDIGAHVGFITLALAKSVRKGGRVLAFEPVPTNIALLEELVALNGLENVVRIVPFAVANMKVEQRMLIWGSSSTHLLEAAVKEQQAGQCQSITVRCSTLDSFVFEQDNPAPDFLKIDVEGAEGLVLEGALLTLKTYSPTMLVEIHGPQNAKHVWQTLDTLNYIWLKVTQKDRIPVYTEQELVSYFRKDSWTHHFLLIRQE